MSRMLVSARPSRTKSFSDALKIAPLAGGSRMSAKALVCVCCIMFPCIGSPVLAFANLLVKEGWWADGTGERPGETVWTARASMILTCRKGWLVFEDTVGVNLDELKRQAAARALDFGQG